MNTLTTIQIESLRHAVREVLAVRHPAALSASAIAARLHQQQMLDFKPTDSAVAGACELLAGLNPPQVKRFTDDLGASARYAATSDGVLAWERRGQ